MYDEPSQSSHAYLAAIVESSDDAIVSKNVDGIIRSFNASAERIFGYKAEEVIGKPITLLIPPDRIAEEDDILRRIRNGERVQHFETVRRTKDGRLIDVSLTISPVRDAAGRVVGASKIARDITGEKRTRAMQAYLAAIVESSIDAILAKDLNGIIQSCNPSCERMYGYRPDELIGQSIYMLIPPERHAEEAEILEKVRRGERVEHFETVRVRKDGRMLDVSLSVSPVRDGSGAIIGVAKVARDITEQKRLARALAAQEEWFRVTLASIGDGVIASDAEGRVTYMNPTAEKLTGWPLDEARGRDLADVFHVVNEETRTRVDNPAQIVIRTQQVADNRGHSALIRRDGEECPIADRAAPIRDDSGAIIGAVLVFRDVTEERRAEDALAEQREWFETTLESIGDAVIATDVQGRVLFMNPVAEHLTGWRLQDALGRPCVEVFKIVNEESRMAVESPVARVLSEGVVVGLANHTVLVGMDGSERPIDDSGAPIRSRDGRVVGAVLVFRDVSERRRADAERRSVALERERLLEAERAARADAERASRVKDEFVAMVSHELRTPLNAILGWTQLMMQARHDADVIDRGLDVIARNTRVQAQLISDLLDMSRIVSGKLRLSIEEVDLRALLESAIETVQQTADSKKITIERRLEASPTIAGDPSRVQQIVLNLLWNAIKFTPEGGRVSVRLRHRNSDAEITVADTGVGIKAEFLPHIFDRFQQGNLSITRRFGGLGLGLSIVKHLVDLHGGSVTAESPGEGQGATFTVVLPSSTFPIGAVAGGATHAADPIQKPTDVLDGIRVLIVEDEADTRDFLRRFLTAYGAQVSSASSAAEALEMLPSCKPALLVSDIGLPDVDGYEMLQRIKRSAAGNIPAIALTAYARAEDQKLAFAAGYDAHVAKPVEPPQLIAAIGELLKKRGVART